MNRILSKGHHVPTRKSEGNNSISKMEWICSILSLMGLLFLPIAAQENSTDSLAQDLSSSSEMSREDSIADSIARRMMEPDSATLAWIAQWCGDTASQLLPKKVLKLGNTDEKHPFLPVNAVIHSGVLEFSFSGTLALPTDSIAKFRTAKDWKIRVAYHDHALRLHPPKKENRVPLIDAVRVEWHGTSYPILAEILLPPKLADSPEFTAWRDSLRAQGYWRDALRGWITDPRDDALYTWLRFGSTDWFSQYLAYASPASYACTQRPEHAACRRYSRTDAKDLCPAGWGLPSAVDQAALEQAWHGDTLEETPFAFGPVIWEVHDEDTTVKAFQLLSPWSGAGNIAPHFWNYVETFAQSAGDSLGLWQFGWSSTGWMSMEDDLDSDDKMLRPIRCVWHGIEAPPETEPLPDSLSMKELLTDTLSNDQENSTDSVSSLPDSGDAPQDSTQTEE
ncbi:MAG TPA: FISUMP domain-containing protein [Fibrobacteraceae bacterium]|nr:FISUMP domain-containing protein [Fibrobacteraceae bacterium]